MTDDALMEENVRLRAALEGVLAHERKRAKLAGGSDCTCINFSRDMERAYETGTCPHQIANAALASTPRTGAVMEVVEAARALVTRGDFWSQDFATPGEYDDVVDALARLDGETG